MKKSISVIVMGLFGCQSGQIELSGELRHGNPAKFVELVKGEPTAKPFLKRRKPLIVRVQGLYGRVCLN